MKKYRIGLLGPISPAGFVIFAAVVLISLATVFNFAKAELAEGINQEQVDAALKDLSQLYGQTVTHEQAKEICNEDKYAADCAEIGKRYDLFPKERLAQVDTILEEIKGKVADEIKSCQTIECLVGVAEGLASKIAKKDSAFASEIGLTPKIVQEKKEIVEIAKNLGLTIDQCIKMDPDTASVELLRGCAKLSKENKVKKYVPTEVRAQINAIADSTERTAVLKEALANGQYQCGDNTISGCGDFCLNPGAEARAAGTSAIPAVCKEIAAAFFGSEGIKELENAYSRVSGVADYYYKKAQNFVFTTLDGQTLTDPAEIGSYLEAQGRVGNVEAVSKGMDFMIAQGFTTQADKDFAVKMVSKFRERGGVADFDACAQNPKACREFIYDDFQDSFDVMDQVFEIMKAEIGFDPNLCEQGAFDESIGLKCLEGGKRALPKIEALASQYPEVEFIVEEIRSHLQRGDQLAQKKEQFLQGNFAGPGGCRNERECFIYCSSPANGPECIAFGAKERISGFSGDDALKKYQQYDYSLNRPAIEEKYITSGQPVSGPYGDAVYPGGFPPPFYGGQPGQPPYGPYGSGYTVPVYGPTGPSIYPPYPSGPSGGQPPYGPSPECLRAITSGDFARAKEFCNVGIGGPGPVPGVPFPSVPICPLSPYEACPAGQYRESFRNNDGCWVDGPCNPIPTYSPGPYPTGPYPTYTPYPGDAVSCPGFSHSRWDRTGARYCQLNEIRSCEFFYPAYLDRASYSPAECPTEDIPSPSYSPGPGGGSCSQSLINLLGTGCHQMYTDSSGRQIYCDGPMSKSAKEGDTAATPGCYGAGPYPTGPYPTYTPSTQCNYNNFCDQGEDGAYCRDCAGTPYPNPVGTCPTGYHYHGEQGGFCMNDREDYSATCYSADGNSQIRCPSQLTGQCTPPQWWDPARGYCVNSTSPAPYPSPGTGACPTGYHYHGDSGGYCMNDREDYSGTCYTADGKSITTCPKPTYTPGPSYTPPPSCPSGQWWDYARNACVSSAPTYSPTSGGTCPGGSHIMYVNNAGGYCMSDSNSLCGPLNSASVSGFGSCSSYQTTPTYTPSPSCPSGQWWDNATNSCTSSSSCGYGYYWDPATQSCRPSTGTATYTPPPSCPSGQWWDGATNSCKSSTAGGYCGNGACESNETTSSCPSDCGSYAPTYTPYAGYCGDAVCSSSETSSSCPSDCGGGGTTYTYTPYPTTEYTPYPTTEYTPPPVYSPPPESSPSPSPSAALYNHFASLHCVSLNRVWDGRYCQPTGFLAKVFENTLANLGKLLRF